MGELRTQFAQAVQSLDAEVACCAEINISRRFRVDLHAIDATPARWRGDAGNSPDALVDFHRSRSWNKPGKRPNGT